MSNNIKKQFLVVGTGPMSVDHVKVLKYLDVDITVVGRGEDSAKKFKSATGIDVITGGLDAYLNSGSPNKFDYVIVAVGAEMLMPVLISLNEVTCNKILVEKPAALSIEELSRDVALLKRSLEDIIVAYNRRFLSSVIETQKLIDEDGGLLSVHFEFTEWSHVIESLKKAPGIKENWFFANSTHVADLAFFLAGIPKKMTSYTKQGSLDWHSNSVFSGAGITENDVIFSYNANWESAGRWSVELLTSKRRIYLSPLEGVRTQKRGTLLIEDYQFDKGFDEKFKPGLYNQLIALMNNDQRLLNLVDHLKVSKEVYAQMIK